MEVSQSYRSKPLGFMYGIAGSFRAQDQHDESAAAPAQASGRSLLAPAAGGDPRASVQSDGLVRASLQQGTIDILAHYAESNDGYDVDEGADERVDEDDRWAEAHDPSPVEPTFALHHLHQPQPQRQQQSQHQHQPQQASIGSMSSSSVVSPTILVNSASNSFLDLDDDDRRESLAGPSVGRQDSMRSRNEGGNAYPMRESTMTMMTTGSQDTMDPFQYSVSL